ncbi:MAG: alkaline phosphatase family protein [Planctomycetes bacterium]|nr:alkaline phosphatase family protein [Planctomycetota bacterium]
MKVLLVALVPLVAAVAQDAVPILTHGPFLGHVDTTTMHVWARAAAPGTWTLHLRALRDGTVATADAEATAANDGTLHFVAKGLAPDERYVPRLVQGATTVFAGADVVWSTSVADAARTATVTFGSCANEKLVPEQPIWARIRARAPHALVLLGDTPYIDLGTVAARRQRHRDFFAFPPIRDTLATIPTWTTWDDHDYATNDTFGAVAGSETARPVFVDYHAHAGYDDGTHGIWTKFRRGPVEVFLLDTRSCADVEPSLLAPGERSALGRAQTEWLQAGLLASTAPCKVLACGMVWNGGVRPGKKDCWGNWLPERDALFAWLGKHDVDGVVLVSGDVHRSRLILHPTRDVVGYDVPEAVTSPLAQNVIEANKVDVPGLAFDAGEASSCLFLTANVDDAGQAVVRLVFQAGDGREFHVREFAPEMLRSADAAGHYRRLQARLHAAFGQRLEGLPLEGDDAPAAWRRTAESAAWRAAVVAAGPAFAAWRLALAVPTLRSRSRLTGDSATEFAEKLTIDCQAMQVLVDARARQALADGDPAVAVAAVGELLAHATHLRQLDETMPWMGAAGVERRAVGLVDAVWRQAGAVAAEPLRATLRTHLAGRPGPARLAVVARARNHRDFQEAIATLSRGKDRQALLARTFTDDVRRLYEEFVGPMFSLGERLGDRMTAADRDAMANVHKQIAARMKERKSELEDLSRAAGAGEKVTVDASADLALMLATLLCPPLDRMLEEHQTAGDALAAAVAK